MNIGRALFPVSRSERCQNALRHIAPTAAQLDAELILMHVLDPLVDGGPKPAAGELKSFKPENFGCSRYRRLVDSHSDTATTIANYAKREDVGMIMMPVPKPTLLQRIFSNVGRRILDQSPCPVWMVNEAQAQRQTERPVQRILCAVSRYSPEVLAYAAQIGASLKAHLILMHIVPDVHEGTLASGFDDHLPLSPETAMVSLKRMQDYTNVDARTLVETGDFRKKLEFVARDRNVDLVVVDRPAPGKVQTRQPALTSFVNQLHCPVLAY
jgi:nucleotide-binding universal stress UspA family protein